jgi:hypothetical protein
MVIARIHAIMPPPRRSECRCTRETANAEGIITEAARGILHGIEKHPWNLSASRKRWRVRRDGSRVRSAQSAAPVRSPYDQTDEGREAGSDRWRERGDPRIPPQIFQ